MRFPDENHEMSRSGKPRHLPGALSLYSRLVCQISVVLS